VADYVLPAGRVASGLLAGVFLAFAVGVMPALRAVDSRTFVHVMNRVNVVIVNPVFLLVFLGAPALAVAGLFVERSGPSVAGAVLGVATLVVTIAWNIPLNNDLAAVSLDGAVDAARRHFETSWTVGNIVRTLTGAGCFVCLLLAGDESGMRLP
jgi:uncharacterized membrane protein